MKKKRGVLDKNSIIIVNESFLSFFLNFVFGSSLNRLAARVPLNLFSMWNPFVLEAFCIHSWYKYN